MASSFPGKDGEKLLIRRGRVESVDLYEIKDAELDLFERGSPADLQLNFAIFLLSISFSAMVSLFTATFSNQTVHTTFVVVAVVGVLIGAYLLIAWWQNRSSVQKLCRVIRKRIKETTSIAIVSNEAIVPPQEAVAEHDEDSQAPEASEPKG
jgi:hypothetical protein